MYTDKQWLRINRVKSLFLGAKITNVQAVNYLTTVLHLEGTAKFVFHYHILGWR